MVCCCGTTVADIRSVEFISTPVGGPQTPIKKVSREYQGRRRRRVVNAALIMLAGASVVMAFVVVDGPRPRRTIADANPSSSSVSDSAARPESAPPPVRPVYRHSVVPGGVRSAEEITTAMQRDEVVAAHYKGVKPELMRNERLQKPLLAHVSYRIGSQVYWTKKPVQLPANEPVLTDGTTTIRERCGNLISMEPLAPASEDEPPLPSFDVLMDPMDFRWQPLVYTPPPLRSIGAPPPPARASQPPPPGTPSPMAAPVPVPEPNTLVLIAIGAAAVAARQLRKRAQ